LRLQTKSPTAPKKNYDDDGEKVTEKFSVEGSKCGRIVGPGGSVIKELQEEFKVKINLDREVDDVSQPFVG
jgi:polyribonucleotide nucleotidyltransferase